jgi:hypothetical protein
MEAKNFEKFLDINESVYSYKKGTTTDDIQKDFDRKISNLNYNIELLQKAKKGLKGKEKDFKKLEGLLKNTDFEISELNFNEDKNTLDAKINLKDTASADVKLIREFNNLLKNYKFQFSLMDKTIKIDDPKYTINPKYLNTILDLIRKRNGSLFYVTI